jgi:nucleotide-binding universal stress UspA family protein
MFKSILVPLDGSQLAEAALPAAASLAEKLGSPVTLLHVVEKNAPASVHSERHLTREDEAESYLAEVAAREFEASVRVTTHVHDREVTDVPGSIAEHASELNPDLIVMCAHGSGGIRNLLFGGIAQQVLAQGDTPLLLVQATTSEKKPFNPQRILVPIDAESLHDDSLPYAQGLAQAYGAEIHLVCVIPTIATLHGRDVATVTVLPATMQALLDAKEEAAKTHLQGHLDELFQTGYRASAEIARGDPAQSIVNVAERVKADLIILCTHRRAGVGAFWAHSVAPDVVRRTRIPILLIPLRQA